MYRHAIEGLFFRSLGERLTPALKAKLREVGLELDQPIPRNTPRTVFAEALRVTAAHLYPGEDDAGGLSASSGVGIITGMEQTHARARP